MRGLLLFFFAATAQARVVLLYAENPSGPKVRAATVAEADLLDRITDPVLYDKIDPDPCVLPPPVTDPRMMIQAKADQPRSVAPTVYAKLSDALKGAAPASGETISVYGMSQGRLLEIRGMSSASFPSEAVLPSWVKPEFDKVIAAIAEKNSDRARLLYADRGGKDLPRPEWEKLGVEFSGGSVLDGTPFFTRQDFEYSKDRTELTLETRAASRPHRVQFFTRFPWTGKTQCPSADTYRQMQKETERQQAMVLTALTGWPEGRTLSRQGIFAKPEPKDPRGPNWP